MKTILLVGKTLEYALYIAASAYLFRIICSIVIGYVLVTSEYAGPCYYYWRKTYCDVDASKTTYSHIAKNSDNDYSVFKTYIGNVQTELSPSELKSASKDLEATITRDEESLAELRGDAGADQAAIDELTRKIEASKKELKALSLTAEGFEPLYADSKFTDSFILGPKKTYKIFVDKSNNKDISRLEPELNFLNFRLAFIKYMKAKGSDTSKYSVINRSDIESFFSNGNPNNLVFEEVAGEEGLTRVSFEGLGTTESFLIKTSSVEPIKEFIGIYTPFKAILDAMEDESKRPIVKFENDKVVIEEGALKNMVRIVELSGLSKLVDDSQSVETAIEGFFDRISKIKPTAFDSHILNRIYYYYFFMNSHLASREVLERDKAYGAAYQKSVEAKKEAEDTSDSESRKDLENKAKVFQNKYLERRTQLIFNHFSQLIAENLGDKGYLLDESEDNRLFFFKWFSYPSVYFSSDEEKHKSIFDDAAATTA